MSLNLLEGISARRTGKDHAAADPQRSERRRRYRMPVRWSVTLWKPDASRAVETVTQNISSSGFYCLSPIPFTPGEVVRCAISVPAHSPRDDRRPIGLDCFARVVRAEATSNRMFGIACRIEEYHLAGPRLR